MLVNWARNYFMFFGLGAIYAIGQEMDWAHSPAPGVHMGLIIISFYPQ